MRELVYGIHSVQSVLNSHPKQILKVYIVDQPRDDRLECLFYRLNKLNINIYECTRRWLSNKFTKVSHQGVVAEIVQSSPLKEKDLEFFLKNCNTIPLILVLDGVTDPHNLGACLRSAYAVGVDMVIIPKNRSAGMNAIVRKVASGAAEHVSLVRVINLSRTLKLLQKYYVKVVGTVTHSDTIIFKTILTGPLALVMGSEGYGIRKNTKKYCNKLISIPMLHSSISLNVSVATGICLFEVLRQRKYA